jgi:hypothetical protein
MKMGKSGLQREMDSFFKETEDAEFNIRRVTKSAFTQARKFLSPEAFLELNDVIMGNFYQNAAFLGYKNHRLLAVDGGFLNLPDHASIREEFGRRAFGRGTKKDVPKSMTLMSLLYDPANYMTLDVQLDHADASELQLLLRHLNKAETGDILLMDRNYPSRYVFAALESKGLHYVVRMKQNWLPVKQFLKSRKQDVVVTMEVPDGDYEHYRQQFPEMKKTIKCRLVKVKDEQGNLQILCTSLLDPAKYKPDELADLYQLRWGIEEGYKMYKARVQVEAFSGKTATAVKQDIYAKIMMMNLCAALAFPIEEKVVKEYREAKKNGEVKHRRKINRTYAYWTTKVSLIAMFIKKKMKAALSIFDKQVESNTEVHRPGRKSPRKKRPPRLYHMNYKDL